MQIQDRIEQSAKEYQLYKNLYEERKKQADEINKNLAEKALKTESQAELYNYIFDNLGSVELLKEDMNQMKIKLYHYLQLAEDLVEVPQEIKDMVEDYEPRYIFTTSGEVANKELYEKSRSNFIQYNEDIKKQLNIPHK